MKNFYIFLTNEFCSKFSLRLFKVFLKVLLNILKIFRNYRVSHKFFQFLHNSQKFLHGFSSSIKISLKSPQNLSDVCMEFSKIFVISTDSHFYKIYPKYSQIFSKFSHRSNKTFAKIFIETSHNLIKIDSKFRLNILTMFKILPNLEISSEIFSTFLKNFSKISSNSIQNVYKNY